MFGQPTWGGIYKKGDEFRVEAILYPADGYVLVVSIGSKTSDFASTAKFRRDFFENRVHLK